MQTDLEIDTKRSVVRVTMSGLFSFAEHTAFYETLMADPRLKPGMTVIWDARSLVLGSLTMEQMRQIGQFVSRYAAKRGRGKAAWVAGDDLGFGMGKIFAMENESAIPVPIRVFRTIGEAEEWAGVGPAGPDEK